MQMTGKISFSNLVITEWRPRLKYSQFKLNVVTGVCVH